MRKFVIAILFICMQYPLAAQSSRIQRLGRWAEGECNAVFRRGGFTFVGSGGYLEVYGGSYNKLDEILLPGPVEDIWVQSDMTHIYVACGKMGLRVVYFDFDNSDLVQVIGEGDTQGYASGVMQYGNYAYVADGSGGIVIFDIGLPSSPFKTGSRVLDGYARDIYVANDTTALIAADSAGLYSLDISNKSNPLVYDRMNFSLPFIGYDTTKYKPITYNVLIRDTVAYVATGWGGMRSISVKDPANLLELGLWVDTSPVEVMDVFETGGYCYLACGEKGLYAPIKVSDPYNMTGPTRLPLDTEGITNAVSVNNDTAFIADGYNGHLLADVRLLYQPTIIDSFETAHITYDVVVENNYGYVAAGIAGVKLFNLDFSQSRDDTLHLTVTQGYDTPGEARGITKDVNYLYIADGSKGMSVINLAQQTIYGPYLSDLDTCYDVYVSGSFAYLACGRDGLRILNVSTLPTVSEAWSDTTYLKNAKAVKVIGDMIYVADSSGAYVYKATGLPSNITNLTLLYSLSTDKEVLGIDAVGDSVFIANSENGFLIWRVSTGEVMSILTGGKCTDIHVEGRTIYISDTEVGLGVYDISRPDSPPDLIEFYPTGDDTKRLDISGSTVCIADGKDGLYVVKSEIKPEIVVDQDMLEFGPVPLGKSRPMVIWIRNRGTTLLEGEISVPARYAGEFHFTPKKFEIPPNDTLKIDVNFEMIYPYPEDVPTTTTASITSNDPDDPLKTLTFQWRRGDVMGEGQYESDELTIGLWHFNETGGTVIEDASANELDGQINGDPQRTGSKDGFGNCISFDGTGDWIGIPYNSLFNVCNRPFTIELWFNMSNKPDDNRYYILARRGNGNTRQFELAMGDNEGLIASVWDSLGVEHEIITGSIDELNTDQWYHVALTWDTDSIRLYLNSVLRASKSVKGKLRFEDTEPLAIGTNSLGGTNVSFRGMIDEVRFSNVARQTWEMNVNRSHLIVNTDQIKFEDVLHGFTRKLPLVIRNGGEDLLEIDSISVDSPESSLIGLTFSTKFSLAQGKDSTLFVSFSPTDEVTISQGSKLIIYSSDPTFPDYQIPISGKGIESLPAGPYVSDYYTLGLYHFEESGGQTIADGSGHGMHGYWTGVSRPVGKFSGSLLFDGYDDICVITPDSTHELGPKWNGFTVEGWLNIQTIPAGTSIIMRRKGDSGSQFDLRLVGSTIVGEIYNTENTPFSVTSGSMGALQASKWYHIALVLDNKIVRLFINGNEVDSTQFSGDMAGKFASSAVDTLSIIIGRDWQSNYPFHGMMDELRISDIGRQKWEFNVKLARISVDSTSINFGKVLSGKERNLKLWVSNPGIDVLEVYNVVSTNTSIFNPNITSFSVQPKDSQLVKVKFTSTDTLEHTEQLLFNTNDPSWSGADFPVFLKGRGIGSKKWGEYESDIFTGILYHFNEGSGESAVDSSGMGRDGILHNSMVWSDTGRFGGSICFDGQNDWIEIPEDPLQGLSHSDFTFEMWFLMLSLPADSCTLVQWGDVDSSKIRLILDSSDGIKCSVWNSSGVKHTLFRDNFIDSMNINQWYHVAISNDGEYLRLLLNNSVLDSVLWQGRLNLDEKKFFTLGDSSSTADHFHGLIDEFRVSRISRMNWEYNVLPPDMDIDKEELNFATVFKGQSRPMTFMITNNGDQDLFIKMEESGDQANVFSIQDCPSSFRLPRLKSREITVIFSPTVSDTTYSGKITIITNDSDNDTVVVNLEGSSTESKTMDRYSSDVHTVTLFHFDETGGSDTVAVDSSGGNHSAILHGGIEWCKGFFGGGLSLDGKDDWIEVEFDQSLMFDMTSQSYTIECYFRTDTVDQSLVSMGIDDVSHTVNYRISINNEGHIDVAGFRSGGVLVSDGSWHHLAFIYNHYSREGRLYIDGILQWTEPYTSTSKQFYQRALIIGAAEKDLAGRYKYFKGCLDEIRISSIARQPWEFQIAEYDLSVSMNPDPPRFGKDLNVSIGIPAGMDIDFSDIILNYRPSGSDRYHSLTAEYVNDTTYQVQIPGDSLRLSGLEYYVKIISTAEDTLTQPVIDPENNPNSSIVRFDSVMTVPITFKHRQFRMFSIPFQLDSTKVKYILEDDLGSYDPYMWRLFWFHRRDTVYVEYSPKTEDWGAFEILPGRSFFLITHLNTTFDIEKFQTVSTDSSFKMSIDPGREDTTTLKIIPGWNMIANPFNFPISWNDCIVSSESITTLYYFNGKGFVKDWDRLDPWEGYFICNQDTVAASLIIPPKRMSEEGSSPCKIANVKGGTLYNMGSDEWVFEISAEAGAAEDSRNFIGVRKDSRDGWDGRDHPEPPPVGDYVSLYFPHDEWELHSGKYTTDLRDPETKGELWNFIVKSNIPKKEVEIKWTLFGDLPKGWQAYIFDIDEGISKDMGKESKIVYRTSKKNPNNYRRFRIVAGTEEFISKNSDGISLQPVEFKLHQNYPNPFNGETSISYSLPKRGRAEIVIFNILGRRIRVLLNEIQKAGHYVVKWDGKDGSGNPVPSGVYIYRLKTAGKVASRKMVIIK